MTVKVSGQPRRRPAAVVVLIAAVAAGLGVLSSGQASANASRTRTDLVTVRVNPGERRTGPVKDGLIGLSFPSSEVNDGHFTPSGNLPALLRNLGAGVLRFGGNSVDRSSFTGITSGAARGLAALATRTGWKVLYSVNLGDFHAAGVTADARRISAALGGHLLAIACGNEPEDFAGKYRPASYDEADYLSSDVPRCRSAVKAGAPSAPFAGPDTFKVSDSSSGWSALWLRPYAKAAAAGRIHGLAMLTAHLYPISNCSGGPPDAGTALISSATEAKERGVLAAFHSASVTAGVPYVISETNSASCVGIPGVSNAYVSALWSADWVMLAAERDATSVDFNGGLSDGCNAYTPLCMTGADQYTARPVYYGMLFAHMLGTGVTFYTPLTISGSADAHIVTHAVVSSSGVVRVMVENLSGVPVHVLLEDGHVSGQADTWYLTGPSLSATSGVRIQGAAVRPNGTFAPGAPGHPRCQAGRCRLSLAAYSAVIVRLPK